MDQSISLDNAKSVIKIYSIFHFIEVWFMDGASVTVIAETIHHKI